MNTNVDMNKRRTEMLYYVLKSAEPVELGELAHLLDSEVSLRTIRDDIKGINCFLERNGQIPLSVYRDMTVEFTGTRRQREASIDILCNQGDYYKYHLNSDERARVIVCHLINADSPVTHRELCTVTAVSRGTLYADMVNCEKVAAEFGLRIVSAPGRGYSMEGPELSKRRAVAMLYKRWSDKGRASNQAYRGVIARAEERFGFSLTDRSELELMRYIRITVERYIRGCRLTPLSLPSTIHPADCACGRFLWACLDEQFQLGEDACEVAALELQCRTAVKLISRGPCRSREVTETARAFLRRVGDGLGAALSPSDAAFARLCHYIEFLRYSAGDYSVFNNYLCRVLERDHRALCDAVTAALPVIRDFTGYEPTGNYRVQLILFVLAFSMTCGPLPALYRTCVICDGGPGEAEYLCRQLLALFPVEIVALAATHTVKRPGGVPDADLIVSTVPVEELGEGIICVNTVMSLSDAERVEGFLLRRRYAGLYGASGE